MAKRLHRPNLDGRLKLCTATLSATFGLLLVGCGSSSEPTESTARLPSLGPAPTLETLSKREVSGEGADLIPVHWKLNGAPDGRRVPIYAERGYCAGDPPPEFKGVLVSEEEGEIYITAYVSHPTPAERAACGGIGGLQRGVVELSTAARESRIYDASTSPATRRWPVEK